MKVHCELLKAPCLRTALTLGSEQGAASPFGRAPHEVGVNSFLLPFVENSPHSSESKGFRSAYDFLPKKKNSFLHNSESKQHDSPPHPGKF